MPVDVSVLQACEAGTAVDTFNRTAETPISDSGKWTNQVLLGESNIDTDGTAAVPSVELDDCSAYRNDTTWSTNVVAMLTILGKNTSDDALYGIYIALQGAGLGVGTPNGYRGEIRVRAGGSADEWRIQRFDVGVATVISSGTIQEIAAGDKFAVVRSGSAIELWWKTGGTWSFIVTASDATYSSGGNVGIYINDVSLSSPVSQLDDLKIANITTEIMGAPSPPVTRVRLRAY